MMKNLWILALALPLVACGKAVVAEKGSPPAAALTDQAIAKSTHTVKCGCKVDGVNSCGNYIEIDNQYVQIANSKDLGLGPMEWCDHGPAQAEVVGSVSNGKFVGTSLTMVAK